MLVCEFKRMIGRANDRPIDRALSSNDTALTLSGPGKKNVKLNNLEKFPFQASLESLWTKKRLSK